MATDDERADIFERAEPTGKAISREEILGRRDVSRMRRWAQDQAIDAARQKLRDEELAVIESEDFADLIRPYVEAALKLDRDMIERACEQSLQGGKHGVLVLRSGQAGPVVSAEVDESVPYGQIHERPFDIDGA